MKVDRTHRRVPGQDKVAVYTPETFNAAEYFHRTEDQDAARYLLHTIECERVFHHDAEPFVPIKARYLQTIMGEDYHRIRQRLEEAQVIEVIHSYVVGERSMLYGLGKQHQEAIHRRTNLESPGIVKRLTRWRRQQYQDIHLPVHKYLRHWLEKIEIGEPELDESAKSYRDDLFNCLRLKDRDFRFWTCPYGRVHTNVTNLSAYLRKYISINGHQLYELDIANSQPYFLALLMLNHGNKVVPFPELVELAQELCPNCISSPETTPPQPAPLHYDTKTAYLYDSKALRKGVFLLAGLTFDADVEAYMDAVCDGTLYEFRSRNVPRDQAKKQLFSAVFFGEHKYHYQLEEDFKKYFPGVYRFIRKFKRKDYRHLAHALQRAESGFVVHRVCKRLMEQYPEIPVLTVHDSILSPDPELVYNVILQEAHKYGLVPKVKVKS